MNDGVLVHLAAGVGNIVLATPLIVALAERGFAVDIRFDADYPATTELFQNWSAVCAIANGEAPRPPGSYRHLVPAVPTFYWQRFAHLYRGLRNVVCRPPEALFAADEQAFYLEFAFRLGFPRGRRPTTYLPVAPSPRFGVTAETVVLAPGCKTGTMAAKRWPWFGELAERLPDVAVVGTGDDVPGTRLPPHARSFIDKLSLAETASLMASAGLVVANDSGLAHVAAACGVPTIMLFGPTSECVLGAFAPHVTVLRAGLHCEPCWNTAPLLACGRRIDCLRELSVDRVLAEVETRLNGGLCHEELCSISGAVPC